MLPATPKYTIYRKKLMGAMGKVGVDARVTPCTARYTRRELVMIEVAEGHYEIARNVRGGLSGVETSDDDSRA